MHHARTAAMLLFPKAQGAQDGRKVLKEADMSRIHELRPVVGICYGMQLLALLYGGLLKEPLAVSVLFDKPAHS